MIENTMLKIKHWTHVRLGSGWPCPKSSKGIPFEIESYIAYLTPKINNTI